MMIPLNPVVAEGLDALAQESGKLRADRDWLLKGIEAIQDGLEDGTAPAAWRNLLAVARWMRAMDQKREVDG